MKKGEKIKIAGSTTLNEADCEYFKSSGSTKIEGKLKADRAKTAGSTSVEGEVFVGTLHTAGSFKVQGKTGAESMNVSGSGRFGNDVTVKEDMKVSGSSLFKGNLKAKTIQGSGSLRAEKNVQAEKVRFTGSFKIGSTLKANEIYLKLKKKSSIKHIEGGAITVERKKGGWFSSGSGSLQVDTIKGKSIKLAGTKADLVEGNHVEIGPKCHIKKVKAKEMKIHEDATIEEKEKRK